MHTAAGFFRSWPFGLGAGEEEVSFGFPPPWAAGAEVPAFGLGVRPRRGFGLSRWSFLRLGEFARPRDELRLLLPREDERLGDWLRLSDLERGLGLPGAADDVNVGVT